MRHASEYDLALYAGGELGLLARRRVASHLRQCPQCRDRHGDYLSARQAFRDQSAELPAGLDWDRLSAEMSANIHLGLAAGECVARPLKPSHLTGWRPAFVLASALAIVWVAWWANSPVAHPPQFSQSAAVPWTNSDVTLEATASGIELNDRGRTLTLKHPNESDVTFSVNFDGAVRARYVDSQTGQVTVNNVYVQ